MRSLFAKILVAQVITVVLALLVVMVITRANLSRGFIDFLERQESAVLDITAPVLAELYEEQGGWDFLRGQPENWRKILRQTGGMRPEGGRGPPQRPRRMQRATVPEHALLPPDDRPLHWLRSLDRLQLRQRLFLLDANHESIAGAWVEGSAHLSLQPVTVADETVGWIGFAPMGEVLPPEAQRFMLGQVRVLTASLLAALALAAVLGFLLARHLSKPVRQLAQAVERLTHGQYETRSEIRGSDETGQLARAVNRLAETLEKNRSARHRWMADIAHELRTPVAILKGEIAALADGVRRADHRTLSSLGEEVDHLAVLVDDLQTLAMSDAGALSLQLERIDLASLVQQVGESFRERLASRGIHLDMDVPASLKFSGDGKRLRQLLNNLLENCARYVDRDGRVSIALTRAAESVSLSIQDSGPGVTTEQLEHLFDRFYRVEQGRSRTGGGSGLGLSICRNIVEAHGGQIRAERSQSGGLAVYTELPA